MLLRLSNHGALNVWRNMTMLDREIGKSIERLSSGKRINRAGDDPAGLAIAERMQTQVRSMRMAVRNAQDGISLINTAESGLGEVHTMLHRMRELALQAANGTLQPEDRAAVQTELDQLVAEVTRLSQSVEFNGIKLLNGSLQDGHIRPLQLQIGPSAGQQMTISIGAMDAYSLGLTRDVLTGAVDPEPVAAAVGKVGTGLAAGTYGIRYIGNVSGNAGTVQLVDADGKAIGVAQDVTAGQTVVLGDSTSARTVELTMASQLFFWSHTQRLQLGAPLAQVGANSPTATLQSNTLGLTITAAGGGLTNGTYSLRYDPNAITLQLFDNLGNAIGTARSVDPFGSAPLTVGDGNTGRTLTVQVPDLSGISGVTSDSLTVTGNPLGAMQVLASADAIRSVGYNLTKGDYRVAYDSATQKFQLQTANGGAIGGWYAADPATDTVRVGEPQTGRTLTVQVQPAIATSGWATVTVLNDTGASAPATFTGGVAYSEARAAGGLNISSQQGAREAVGRIDNALRLVSSQRGQLGAAANGLEHTIANLTVTAENLEAAESRIRDVDVALEMSRLVKLQIQMQASMAMMAQAHQMNRLMVELVTRR